MPKKLILMSFLYICPAIQCNFMNGFINGALSPLCTALAGLSVSKYITKNRHVRIAAPAIAAAAVASYGIYSALNETPEDTTLERRNFDKGTYCASLAALFSIATLWFINR